MKILIFEPEYIGHYLQYVSYIIDAYHSQRHKIILATTKEAILSEQYKEFLFSKKEKFGVIKFSKLFSRKNKHLNRLFYSLVLKKLAKKIKPDLIFIPFLDSIFFSYSLFGSKKIKTEGILFRGEYIYPPFTLKKKIKQILTTLIINHGPFPRILCLDELNYNYLIKKQKKDILDLCPDPVENFKIDKKIARKKLNLTLNAKILGCVGSIDKRKGIDLLIKAIIKRKSKQNEYLLLVGGQNKDIINLTDKYQNKNIISINKFVSQKDFLFSMAAMDIVAVVHPQHIGSSGTLIQAAAAEKPVLGSNFGWIGHMMKKYQLGYSCNVQNEDELIKGVDWAFSNPGFNKIKAKEFAEQNTVDKFKKKILN
jgi:glycosyltransferase involved in cell wall biosynthesis